MPEMPFRWWGFKRVLIAMAVAALAGAALALLASPRHHAAPAPSSSPPAHTAPKGGY